jgi:hypothetical protein
VIFDSRAATATGLVIIEPLVARRRRSAPVLVRRIVARRQDMASRRRRRQSRSTRVRGLAWRGATRNPPLNQFIPLLGCHPTGEVAEARTTIAEADGDDCAEADDKEQKREAQDECRQPENGHLFDEPRQREAKRLVREALGEDSGDDA